MAMNEELLASIDDRLMQLVEEMKRLTALLDPRGQSDVQEVPTQPIPHPQAATTRRLGLSPEKKSTVHAGALEFHTLPGGGFYTR